MTRTYTKNFEYKGQQVNYLTKLRADERIANIRHYLDAETGKWIIEWEYYKK